MLKLSSVITEWIKVKELTTICFVGKEAVAFGWGCHLLFYNLTTAQESHYRADLKENGDGVACLSGHKIFSIFAFAESCANARILVLSYPEFQKISILDNKKEDMYISITFSETEHLIALTGMPDYQIQVWYWRTQDQLISQNSEIETDKQKIICSQSLPLTVCQLAYQRGLLTVWEVHGTQKFCKLIQRRISLDISKLDGPFDTSYSIEGNLNIVNRHGSIFNVIPSSGIVNLIAKGIGGAGSNSAAICSFRGGIIVTGPDGVLKHYKKQKYVWNEQFSSYPSEPLQLLKTVPNRDILIGATEKGSLIKVQADGERLDYVFIKKFDKSFTYFSLLYPLNEYLIAVSSSNDIETFDLATEEKVSTITVNDHTSIKGNPLYPFIAIGNSQGIVYLISMFDAKDPQVLTEFHLSHFKIVSMVFSDSGRILIIADAQFNIFIIQGLPGSKMEVIHQMSEEQQILNFVVTEADDHLNILMLLKSDDTNKKFCSNHLVRLSINLKNEEKCIDHLELPGNYIKIAPIFGFAKKFYGVQYCSNKIDILQILENREIKIVQVLDTFHQLRHVNLYCNRFHLITWGIDGIVNIFDSNNSLLSSVVTHNRYCLGVKQARCDSTGQFLVSLGYSGNLVCSKIAIEPNQARIDELKCSLRDPMVQQMFTRPTIGYVHVGDQTGKRFLDMKDEQKYRKEKETSESLRKDIILKVADLKQRLQVVVDTNEQKSEEEQLSIQDFNLNICAKDNMIQISLRKCELEKQQTFEFIDAQSKINDWILRNCWEPVQVKGVKLHGIFTQLTIENFPLMTEKICSPSDKIQLNREIENTAALKDIFLPWRPIPTQELEKLFAKEPDIGVLDESAKIFRRLMLTLIGSNSHTFIKISELHYQQLDVISFHQMQHEQKMTCKEIRELKLFFNKQFDTMHKLKQHEIEQVKTKNDRLRHIQQELKMLDALKGKIVEKYHTIVDPIMLPDEQPDDVVEVQDWEVCVSPYISPSHRKFITAEKLEIERRRLAMLADDFRDRALDIMMDGVLEHRWEDEIKKNPIQPDCLIKKKYSDDYSELDLRELQDYKEKMYSLNRERENYRKMLHDEQNTMQKQLDHEIREFNYKANELLLTKKKIEAAVGQEEMKLLLFTWYNFRRLVFQRDEISIKINIEKIKANIEDLNQIQSELTDKLNDLKANYDNLSAKDKLLDKQFKMNFGETAPSSVVDQAYKFFKRRPKFQMRAQITSPILQELARRCVQGATYKRITSTVSLLPVECLEFLTGLDTLDQVSSATTGIDATSWSQLCKMRRIKVESEFKLKGLGIQLADAEATQMAFAREINSKKNQLLAVEKQLLEHKEIRDYESTNRSVQIVIQRGLIEIPLSGKLADFNDCILIHRSDVDEINKVIKKAGSKKMRAMLNAAQFRRKIISQEWDHKVLQLTVRDMREYVKTIEKCKITKEVQMWLKRKEKGWTEDLGQAAVNREIENAIFVQEKALNELVKEVNEIEFSFQQKKRENKILDKRIQLLNMDVNHQTMMRDVAFEEKEIRQTHHRMEIIVERAKLVRLIQLQHANILELSTLLELQRLKTYPTLTASHGSKGIKNV